ncbi:hypothetical protein HHI36_012108 [Cryptolaemus montrouzieri]|uniref:CLIP domain-containing serine protease n=1 Tax=Cryptolaemus montrouzieri TaxID=559131 RepID=A0ABD2ND96_9CUCU
MVQRITNGEARLDRLLINDPEYVLIEFLNEEQCQTPNGDTGECISIYSCQILLTTVRSRDPQQTQFLRDSNCGFDTHPLVCCGRYSSYHRESSTNRNSLGNRDTTQNHNTGLSNDRNNNRGQEQNKRKNSVLLSRSSCGTQTPDKILGGQATAPDEFPWMALLQYHRKNGETPFSCGGSLISDRYVLTAAHCVTGAILTAVGRLYSVRLGEWDLTTDRDCQTQFGFQSCNEPPVDILVEDSFAHPSYSDKNQNRPADIALVKLRDRAQLSSFIRPICLPSSTDRSEPGNQLFVAGWGELKMLAVVPKS